MKKTLLLSTTLCFSLITQLSHASGQNDIITDAETGNNTAPAPSSPSPTLSSHSSDSKEQPVWVSCEQKLQRNENLNEKEEGDLINRLSATYSPNGYEDVLDVTKSLVNLGCLKVAEIYSERMFDLIEPGHNISEYQDKLKELQLFSVLEKLNTYHNSQNNQYGAVK